MALFLLALALPALSALPAPLAAQDDLVRRPVPEVVGLSYSEARVRILRARVGPVEVVDTAVAGVDSATVVRQEPAGGVQAVVPTTVTLWVSRPPRANISGIRTFLMDVSPTPEVTGQVARPDTMPDLRGRPLREGLKLLQVMKLEAVTEPVASQEPPGTVVRHLPAPGATVEPGGLVRLWVADAAAGRTVPRVVGMPLEKAFEAFAVEGIQVARVDTVAVDPDGVARPPDDGTVVRQAPPPDDPLEPGATGRLVVAVWDRSVEPARGVLLPDVVGRPLEEAIGALEQAGAGVGQVVSVVSPEPARSVVEQKPPGGTEVPPGAEVALAVSEGPRVTVPDLVGAPLERAGRTLEAAGLVLDGVTRVPSEEDPEGTVVDQSPEAGRSVGAGARVDLTVAAALPEPATVSVPELVGRAMEEAEGLLDAAGLRVGSVELVNADAATGTVVAQFPPAGTRLAADAAVRLDVAAGARSEPVPVPEVVGMDREAALASLSSAGLRRVDTRGSGTEVVDQFPSPGALVAPGTPVLLTFQAQTPEGAQGTLPGWLGRWEVWGLPVGIALLWALLRLRRVVARGGTEETTEPDRDDTPEEEPEEAPEPTGRVEYRLMRASPRGSVEAAGPLLPELALSLRPRPPRTLGATLELPPDGRLSAGPDPDPAPPRSDEP